MMHTIVLFTVCVCIKTSIHRFNRPSIIRTGPLYSQCRKMIDAAVYLFEKEKEKTGQGKENFLCDKIHHLILFHWQVRYPVEALVERTDDDVIFSLADGPITFYSLLFFCSFFFFFSRRSSCFLLFPLFSHVFIGCIYMFM